MCSFASTPDRAQQQQQQQQPKKTPDVIQFNTMPPRTNALGSANPKPKERPLAQSSNLHHMDLSLQSVNFSHRATSFPNGQPAPSKASAKDDSGEKKKAKYPGDNKCGIALKDGTIVIRGAPEVLIVFKKWTIFDDCVFEDDAVVNSGRLIAIDFDKTLVEIFLWAELGGLEGECTQQRNLQTWIITGQLRKAFGSPERVSRLREVLQACKDRGDLLCVLSSGLSTVICPALRHMQLDDLIPVELVYGSDCCWPPGCSKSKRMLHLKRHHGRKFATLIDDEIGYCKSAMVDGHDVIWVKKGDGMQELEFDKILKQKWDSFEMLTYLNDDSLKRASV